MNTELLKLSCVASSVYKGSDLVGRNVTITLPAVTPATVDVMAAGGTITMPIWQRIGAMETTVSTQGIDDQYAALVTPEPFDLVYNIVQQAVQSDGTSKSEHIKTFSRVIPKVQPGFDLKPGEQADIKIPYSVLSYRVVKDGKEILNVDIPNGKLEVNGKNYMDDINSML